MKSIPELEFGHNDASQYLYGRDKNLFNQLFFRTPVFEKLLKPKTYFLIGEKGTGKTAFAVYLSNQNSTGHDAQVQVVGNTEYRRFIELKNSKKLSYSDYTAVWRVLLLLLVSQKLKSDISLIEKLKAPRSFPKLCEAIDDFYSSAFVPEFEQAFEMIYRNEESLKLIAKALNISIKEGEERKTGGREMVFNLFHLEKGFKSALSNVRLSKQHILFIDGLDQRPPEVSYKDYISCLTGLLEAVWELNHEFFSVEKQLREKIKIVVLCRSDVLYKAGIHNVNSKLTDNSVVLSWVTELQEFQESISFQLIDHTLGVQQPAGVSPCDWFKQYIRFQDKEDDAFRSLLRVTWHRPRDYVTLLRILQDNRLSGHTKGDPFSFSRAEFEHASFSKRYAKYLLGEVRDYSMFYMNSDQFDIFLKFFQGLDGKATFNYKLFVEAYDKFRKRDEGLHKKIPVFSSADSMLQYLYDTNIIAYEERSNDGDAFYHWSFREKGTVELHPKIKTDSNYRIHQGIAKALDVGKSMKSQKTPSKYTRSGRGIRH